MTTGRLETFSDGVLAIIITIMVLEMKVPHGAEFGALQPMITVLLSYVLSFIYLGIYWNNHHHMMHVVHRVSGGVLWANLLLLFWLSLIPFVTGWMGENHFAPAPMALYGVVLLFAGVAFSILVRTLLRRHPGDSALARAIGSDFKGNVSVVAYVVAVAVALVQPGMACAVYVVVALLWLVPDRRVERALSESHGHE